MSQEQARFSVGKACKDAGSAAKRQLPAKHRGCNLCLAKTIAAGLRLQTFLFVCVHCKLSLIILTPTSQLLCKGILQADSLLLLLSSLPCSC